LKEIPEMKEPPIDGWRLAPVEAGRADCKLSAGLAGLVAGMERLACGLDRTHGVLMRHLVRGDERGGGG
jgi:hypothetical protein